MYTLFGGVEFFQQSKNIDETIEYALSDLKKFSTKIISHEAKDLILSMLKTDPSERISAEDALNHPFFSRKKDFPLDEFYNGFLEGEKLLFDQIDNSPNLIGQTDFYEVYKFVKKKTGEIFSEEIFYLNIDDYSIDEKKNILRTLNIMVNIHHPSILKCFEFTSKRKFLHENYLAVLTEPVSSNSLQSLFSSHKFDVEFDDTLKLIQIFGIASAMAHLHSLNILHLDLSPKNVLEDENLHPKLANFGMKNVFRGLESIQKINKISFYDPPELFIENKYDKSSEVYSFSLIVYQIVTGENPFENVSLVNHVHNILNHKRPSFKKTIGKAYRFLIEECWEYDPLKRPTFENIVDRLIHEKDFITSNVNYNEYKKYVEFVESEAQKQGSKEPKNDEKCHEKDDDKKVPTPPNKEKDKKQKMKKPNKEEEEEEEEEENYDDDEEEEEEEENELSENQKKTLEKIHQICDDLDKNHVNEFVFKDFRIKEELGSGWQGRVCKATKRRKNRHSRKEFFAAKIFLFDISRLQISDHTIVNFKRELIHHSMCSHPSIIKFNGYCYHRFRCSKYRPITMTEFAKNGNLRDIITEFQNDEKNKGLVDTKKLIIIYGIAASMAYLHSLNIIHRDLKPDNILIDENFFPKLSDFGISLKVENIDHNDNKIVGTKTYIAPEIMKDEGVCKASDVYSFAIILYDIVLNDFLFECFTLPHYLNIVCVQQYRPNIDDNIVPKSYIDLIESCWDDDKLKRPAFSDICNSLKSDVGFITDNIDQKAFFSFVDFIDKQLKH